MSGGPLGVVDRALDGRIVGLQQVRAILSLERRDEGRVDDQVGNFVAVDLRDELGQREHLARRQVSAQRLLDDAHQLGRARKHVELQRAIAQAHQHSLLPSGPCEITRAVPRARVLERRRAIHQLWARHEVDALIAIVGGRVLVVFDRPVRVDDHAAHRVDELLEAAEVHPRVVLYGNPEIGSHRANGQIRATESMRNVDPLLTPTTAIAWRTARDADPHVARQRHKRGRLGNRIDAGQDDRVRAGAGDRFVVALVDAQQQDVDPIGALPVRQHGLHHRGDAAGDVRRLDGCRDRDAD